MDDPTVTEQVKDFVKQQGLVRRQDVEDAGFPGPLLYRLRDRGELLEVAPGLFKHPESDITAKHTYAEAAKLVPRGVICLTSALAFHEIGTQMPGKVWMALDRSNRRRPEISQPPMEFVWFSGPAFEEGQEVHEIEGVEVRIYSPAKTVADLFKFRNKIGLNVALEGLREGWQDGRFTMEELQHYGETCNVRKVMRPYLQALISGP
jgi:predicted transcriptional regulator of viral defense system